MPTMALMPITLEQVQAQLQAAWEAINVGELSFTHDGHQTTFNSLDAMQRHIDWLRSMESDLLTEASETGGSIIVRFVEGG